MFSPQEHLVFTVNLRCFCGDSTVQLRCFHVEIALNAPLVGQAFSLRAGFPAGFLKRPPSPRLRATDLQRRSDLPDASARRESPRRCGRCTAKWITSECAVIRKLAL